MPHLVIVNGAFDEWDDVYSWDADLDECLLHEWHEDDRPGANIGVAASWNRAFESAQRHDIEYVALVSQSLVIEGGTARLAQLVDEHADERGLLTDHAWHCIVLSVAVWEKLGPFDEGFFAYYEDSDYVRRMFLADVHSPSNPMRKVEAPEFVATCGTAATMKAGLLPQNVYGDSHALFRAKWGGEPFHETFARPFDPDSKGMHSNWTEEAARADR